MDERRLDQFFKEELEEFPQPKLKEGAWERMRSRLPEPKSRQGLWTWLSLASLLLLASLIVNFFLWNRFQNQQTQIHTLSKNISAIQHQFSSKTDTLYICQTDSIFIQNTPVYYTRPQGSVTSYDLKESSPKFASTQPDNKIDVSPNQASSSIEQSLKTDADTSNSATEKSTSFLTKTEESTTKIEPSTITESGNTPNAKDTVFIKTETRRVDTVFADSKATPKAKKNQMLKDIKEYFTSRGLAWGLLSEIGTFSTAVADEGNAFGFGLGVQGSISPRFSLYSAFRFRRSFYKIEDNLSEVSSSQLNRYPGIVSIDPTAILNEIYANTDGLNLGLGLRYDLIKSDGLRLALLPSVQFQSNLSQQFVYEYQNPGGEEDKFNNAAGGTPWQPRSLRFAIQTDFPVGRFRPQLGLFYQTDINARGVEKLRFNQIGFSASWWWFSNKYFK